MGRIRILSDNVANKIAAGEVVERPASVVKELLENSLDAGATDLRIDVESGGRRLLRVTDNGCGMMRDDALLAFERHATSKLSDVKDLEAIATLGFRGEALPSIAAVSRLVLETRTCEEPTGTRVELAGGKLLNCEEAALAPGTVITVRDLFFNVPARRKFLRTEQTELAHIASLVTHYSLAHPDKSFHLRNGANDLLRVTPVEELRERIFQVFGSRILEDLVDLGAKERELPAPRDAEPGESGPSFLLRGFVSRPQVQKLNRNSIFLFVNRRLIKDRLLLHAITSAYHNLIPPACYPFALLFLDCDAAEVDVNVHPSKTEVRFRNATVVHDFVRDAIRETLMDARPAASVPVGHITPQPAPQPGARLPYSEFSQQIENVGLEPDLETVPPAPEPGVSIPAGPVEQEMPEFTLRADPGPMPRLDFTADPVTFPGPEPPPAVAPPLRLRVPDTHGSFPAGLFTDTGSLTSLPDLRPLGQLHDSFIVAAGRDGLWIIDQHVAHERILFEKVLRERAAGRAETQRLLMPILVELTPGQQVEYARIATELNAIGFESEPFGTRTIAVKAVPAGVALSDVEKLIYEILEIGEGELRKLTLDDLRRGLAATIACRAAIKINTPLDAAKMQYLLDALSKTDNPMSCPHGRPIALRYGTRDILRAFHRI